MIKALLIAPYQGLAETAKKMKLPNDLYIDIMTANLEEGVEAAKLAEQQGYELIISRGGTATLIQKAVTIPVVHLDITGYDMLRVFTLISGMKENVALVGFSNISQGAATICNILEYDVKMVTITRSSEVTDRLKELKEQGYEIVIGDVITVQVAKQLGMRGVLITSGREALMDAFDEARRIHTILENTNSRLASYRNIFNAFPQPFVIIDPNQNIIEKSVGFKQIFKNTTFLKTSSVLQLTKKVIETKSNQWTEVVFDNRTYEIQAFLASNVNHWVGMVIQPSLLKNGHSEAMTIIDNPIHYPIIGESEQIRQLKIAIANIAQTSGAICIVGEAGTGKFTVAQAIHFKKYGQNYPIIVLDGNVPITDEDMKKLQVVISSVDHATVVIKQITSITIRNQKQLLNMLYHKSNAVQFIFLLNQSLEKLLLTKCVDDVLYKQICQKPVYLAPLRERKIDIADLVHYFLAELHTENGNEIVGMKAEAITYLSHFEWKGNVSELKQVVRELSLMNTNNYIELKHVVELMENRAEPSVNDQNLIQGTLKEIEQKIIKRVMQEEANNQSRVASRLGINRSTLWRKLKEID